MTSWYLQKGTQGCRQIDQNERRGRPWICHRTPLPHHELEEELRLLVTVRAVVEEVAAAFQQATGLVTRPVHRKAGEALGFQRPNHVDGVVAKVGGEGEFEQEEGLHLGEDAKLDELPNEARRFHLQGSPD